MTGPIHPDRRTVLRGGLVLGAGSWLGAALTGCAATDRTNPASTTTTPAPT